MDDGVGARVAGLGFGHVVQKELLKGRGGIMTPEQSRPAGREP